MVKDGVSEISEMELHSLAVSVFEICLSRKYGEKDSDEPRVERIIYTIKQALNQKPMRVG